MIITEQLDFFQPLVWQSSDLPRLFSASHQANHAGKRQRGYLCQIIIKAVGDRMGLPVDADQLQLSG